MNIFLNFPSRIAVALLASAICTSPLVAQVGSDNPTGTSGSFNGSITTGGSYDPYTGNATRSITDLTVPGGIGTYPLAFTRTMNSRYMVGSALPAFGPGGNWSHNFQWSIPTQVFQSNAEEDPEPLPASYSVDYPDGRRIAFSYSDQDSAYRAFPGSGIADRFEPLDGVNGGYCYLLLPDGGKIQFTVTVVRVPMPVLQVRSTFTFKFTGIVDPYGQFTSVTYPPNAMLVEEPGGRQLKLCYLPGTTIVDRVEELASAGAPARRTVQYHYITHAGQRALSKVVYFGDPNLTATYTYQNSNVNSAGRPLLSTADDPMYAGPMRVIAYEYATGAGVVHGQILREKHPNGTHVSTLSINGNSRTEIRGDGPTRSFNYSSGKLVNYTDFKGQASYISYDGYGYIGSTTDARGHTTTMVREGTIGAVSRLIHHDQSYVGFAYWYSNGGPYHLQIRGNERGRNTYFIRDANFRLTRIDYPDYPNGAYEEFAYNHLGQVVTHRMTTGGTTTSYYDGRGMMYASSNIDGTTYYYYDALDRLEHVTDPRDNTTWFQYNARGQVTRVTHMDGSFIQTGYDNYGNKTSVTDELNHPTTYTYDDYNRLLSMTNALNKRTSYYYAQGWANSYNHTTPSPKAFWSPMGKGTHFAYDENWRRTILREAAETADDAWTFYNYDAVGNLISVQNPRNHVTSFGYDNRNRRERMTNALNQTTTWQYDATNNMIRETRPDQSFRRVEYDSMNRVIDTYGFADERIQYGRDLAGNVASLTDPKGATYRFYYDALGRKVSQWYPTDATGVSRYDAWYRDRGKIYRHDSPGGQVQIFEYDNRNRMKHSYWWGHVGPKVRIAYDNAGRATNISTINPYTDNAETNIAFGYDDANQQVWEEQTLAGYPTRRVETPRDADGNRDSLNLPGWFMARYDYTNRNQLAHIYGAEWAPWFSYSYDRVGNLLKRQDVLWDVNDSVNVPPHWYDPLDRPVVWENTGAGDTVFARSWYQYDNVGREVATWRDEQGGKGERFYYSPTNQLTNVRYNADQVSTGNPVNWDRWVDYGYTPDTLNRRYLNDNGSFAWVGVSPLNQYTSIGEVPLGYDGNFNLNSYGGWAAIYNAQNQLTSASANGNSVSFTYDGLGRCVRRVVSPASGGSRTTLIAYDGWKPTVEWDGAGNFQAWNVYGPGADEILWRYDATVGQHLRYHHDRRGNVTFVLDGSGNVLEKYTYDAFGTPKITDANGNVRTESAYGNRFLFQGREWIKEVGIYDYRNRFYHPTLGRFLQSDPIGFAGGDANLYRYCGNDPVNLSDPSGLTVEFGEGADVDAINAALDYLNQSPTFAGIYSGLQNSSQVYTINTVYGLNNGYFDGHASGGIITWNPNGGQLVTSGGLQSAAIVLAHELAGHGRNWDANQMMFILNQRIPAGVYDNREEYNAVQIESQIARELRETTRSDHRGAIVSARGPTHRRVVHLGTTGNVIPGPWFGIANPTVPSWSLGGPGTAVTMSSVPGIGWMFNAQAMVALNPPTGGGPHFREKVYKKK